MGLTTEQTVRLVEAALAELDAGPEKITVACPDGVAVDWDDHVPPARASKIHFIRGAVRASLHAHLHQMPQVLLIADDGVVTGLYGPQCGTAAPAAALAVGD